MTLRQSLNELPFLKKAENIFFQNNLTRPSVFEKKYLALREKEGRLYSDSQLKELPSFDGSAELIQEWQKRKSSMNRLVNHLGSKTTELPILEFGCGNGWLSNRLSESLGAQVLGMDLNETELLQGARVFKENNNLTFLYADLFSAQWSTLRFDIIVLASSIQYFADVGKLIGVLLRLINPGGEIHILDSPLYLTLQEKEQARLRSIKHFVSLGFEEMKEFYFHHQWADLKGFDFEILHNPQSLISKLKNRILSVQSPFPHLVTRS